MLYKHLKQGTLVFKVKHAFGKRLKNFMINNSIGKWFLLRINKSQDRCYISKNKMMSIDISGICNLSCVMCVYDKAGNERKPGQMMSLEVFKEVFHSVVQSGYRDIEFCPARGEVFLNKDFWPILNHVDSSSIRSIKVVTNFIPIRQADINRLFLLNKLKLLEISIYGFDLESFKKITRKGQAQFNRLKTNLDFLRQNIYNTDRSFKIHIRWWVGDAREFESATSEFKQYILELGQEIDKLEIKDYADNRAGMISSDNVDDSGVKVRSSYSQVLKFGPCRYLFTDFIVNNDLSVSTCRCYDHTGKLFLGYFDEKPLSQILSGQNELFNQIITEQERGIYRDPCNVCSQYKSIYFGGGNCLSYQQLKNRYAFNDVKN